MPGTLALRSDDTERTLDLDDEGLSRVLSPTSLALLRTVATERPGSIRATAEAVDRDVKNVHENLMELSRLGLVAFEWEGRARKPVVDYDELTVTVSLHENRG